MDKIINIQERIEIQKNRSHLKQYQKKIDTLRRFTQCSSCGLKCSMCSQYLDETDTQHSAEAPDYGFVFCDCCREEFEDFLSLSRGERGSQFYWHNKEWKRMWSAWLRYRRAIHDFLHSREFATMLDELEHQP